MTRSRIFAAAAVSLFVLPLSLGCATTNEVASLRKEVEETKAMAERSSHEAEQAAAKAEMAAKSANEAAAAAKFNKF